MEFQTYLIMDRKTQQYLLPYKRTNHSNRGYDVYPTFPIDPDTIHMGRTMDKKTYRRPQQICS